MTSLTPVLKKQFIPIELSEAGKINCSNLRQFAKQLNPNELNPLPNVIEFNTLQFPKEYSLILRLTPLENVIVVNEVHESNALFPI